MSKTAAQKVRESGSESPEPARAVPDTETEPPTKSDTPATARARLRVPVPTVGMRMARVPLPPGPRTVATGVSSATTAVRNRVPDRESLLYFGGLGAAAVTGLVSWPVAGAIGVGVWVAEHARRGPGATGDGARG
ncbi:hypothetical protein [Nocardia sputorum]|uniref:Uncharacterized protein n=1 Tax=Nocardia sputorum TaxID=2984338 RepID=A0ABM8D0P9_9NOCA|nr:hypothetical protein [Nocardia sputorum]BDT92290.1 hypothetical protein IFM12275_22660 [Nocardia sputorum]BDU00892.1 hypothetical protein IFM12276_39200 [Nocardia sputorum]